MRNIILLALMFFIIGCGGKYDNVVGPSKAKMYFAKNDFKDKYDKDSNKCIKNNEIFKLSLNDLKLDKIYRGDLDGYKNEIGVIVSVYNQSVEGSKKLLNKEVIDFKYGIYPRTSPNTNLETIFEGRIADIGDLIIEIELIEYDGQSYEFLKSVKNDLVELSKAEGINSIPQVEMIGNILQNSLIEKYMKNITKDDLIFKHKLTLQGCNTFKTSDVKKMYLMEGEVYLVRALPKQFEQIRWDSKMFTQSSSSSEYGDGVSYIKFEISKRFRFGKRKAIKY